MSNPQEIECARIWRITYNELQAFIRTVCEKDGVEIEVYERNTGGRPNPRTIAYHDMHIGVLLVSPDPISRKSNRLGVRLRQNGFKPFATIWSDKTMMKEFHDLSDLTALKDEITTAIHATLS